MANDKKANDKKALEDDKRFIKLFRELERIENLTQEQANKLITKAYPDHPFKVPGKTHNVLIRPLVYWKINNMVEDRKTIKQIFELIDNVYPKLYTNVYTIDNMFTTDVRQPVLKRWPSPTGNKHDDSYYYNLVKEMVALPMDVKGKMLQEQKDKVTAKLRSQTVVDINEILDLIKNNITSTDPMRRAIALLISCGSRAIEFFAKSKYEIYNFENSNSWVTQTFIAKKRNKEQKTHVVKPILYFSNERFIQERENVLEQLRVRYKNKEYSKTFIEIDKDKEKLAGVILESGNKAAKEVFSHREGFSMHTSRALYAIISYDMFGQKKSPHGSNHEFRQWVSDVLGKEGDNSATREYAKFVLSHKLNVNEIPAKTEELVKKVEDLEERLDTLNINQDEKPLPSVIVKNAKEENQMRTVQGIYDDYIKTNYRKPNLSRMEEKTRGIVPRRITRIFMKWQDQKE